MEANQLRIVFVGKDIELRIVSLVVRAQEAAAEVVLLDRGSNDETQLLAEQKGCNVIAFSGEISSPAIASAISELEVVDYTLIIVVRPNWRLRDFPLLLNRVRERWDVHLGEHTEIEAEDPANVPHMDAEPVHLILSPKGLEELAAAKLDDTPMNLPDSLRVRVVYSDMPANVPQRESLASASRFAQMFYWMLESKHPLILFGIPGLVCFILGYQLSGNVITTFDELNKTSLGVTLATIAVTLIGLFAMMVAVILYILGKQVKQLQSQYEGAPEK